MKELKLDTKLYVFDSCDELPEHVQRLMEQAAAVREQAYAPYSEFKVGAAVLLRNGTVVLGSNQENAAYPSGLCAERTAVFSAGSNYPGEEICCICISGSSVLKETSDPIPPCGACRQSLLEYEIRQKKDIPVYFMGKSGMVVKSPSIQNLLPFIFKEENL